MELFRYPAGLIWLLAGFAALIFFRFRAKAASERIARRLMSPAQIEKLAGTAALARKKRRESLYLAALLLLILAAAGPQWGVELAPVSELEGNLVIAVDTSASMSAKDLKPSRMENAKLLVSALADKFPDYRLGIVAFSGQAFVQCPLTTDSDALKYFLSYLAPDMLPVPGTDISAAIATGAGVLAKYGGQKIVVLITDGEDHSGKLDEILSSAESQNLRIFTVGLGKTEGDLIPVLDQAGAFKDYKKDDTGKTVVTKLDETTLLKIAGKTGAEYIRYGGDPEATASEIRDTVARIALAKAKGFGKSGFKNRYQIPLILAIILLLIELLLMEQGSMSIIRTLWKRRTGTITVLPLFIAALIAVSAPARAGEPETLARKGNKAYNEGNFPKAYEYYSRAVEKAPKNGDIMFNRGAAFYRLEDYPGAAKDFEAAAEQQKTKSRSSYNAGNAYFRLSDFPKAVESYRKAVLTDPGDENAKYNLQKALEQIKQQKQEKKKKQDKGKNEKKDKGGSEDKKNENKEEKRRKEAAKQQADKLLELMKEKEKSAGSGEMMNARFTDKRPPKDNFSGKNW